MRSASIFFAFALTSAGCASILGGDELDGVRGPDDLGASDTDSGPHGGSGDNPGQLGNPDAGGTGDDGSTDPDDAAPTRDARPPSDAPPPDAPPPDSGSDGSTGDCPPPLAAGDLVIVEAMVASVTGSGDTGEWVELQSTRSCRLNLNGLHVASPRGAGSDTVDVTQDTFVPALGTVVVANTSDPALNHSLPGVLLTWAGSPTDVLKNTGDSVTLSAGATTIDTLTYTSTSPWGYGTSMTFAAGCAASLRTDMTKWTGSKGTWTAGFFGTPNAPNSDVTCP
jgi:hypothetical protein